MPNNPLFGVFQATAPGYHKSIKEFEVVEQATTYPKLQIVHIFLINSSKPIPLPEKITPFEIRSFTTFSPLKELFSNTPLSLFTQQGYFKEAQPLQLKLTTEYMEKPPRNAKSLYSSKDRLRSSLWMTFIFSFTLFLHCLT